MRWPLGPKPSFFFCLFLCFFFCFFFFLCFFIEKPCFSPKKCEKNNPLIPSLASETSNASTSMHWLKLASPLERGEQPPEPKIRLDIDETSVMIPRLW